ncbi:hypothetical protein HYZ70_01220 [Candidatus Curtissbacteria bacterium]|nr:hypothetical protein [Candidatus Curtissbacteria bacterium]
MALPSILGTFFKKGPAPPTNYLSLVLAPDRVLATIWTFENEELKTLGYGHKTLASEDILIHQAAITIDSAGQQAKVDVTKTVFGLSEYYLEDGALSQSATKTLKKLSQELELDPEAFVPIATGINHLLKVEESATPQTLALGIFGDFCEVHLLEGGTVTQSKSSQAPINIEKIKNLTKALKVEDRALPARIIVYGVTETSDLAGKIVGVDWSDIFMHEPKIDFFDDAQLSRSVAYAQAADILGYEVQIKRPEEPQPQTAQPKANELGFVEGEDILLSAKTGKEEEYRPQPEPPKNSGHKAKNWKLPLPSLAALLGFGKILATPSLGKKITIGALALLLLVTVGAFVYGQTVTTAEVRVLVNGQELKKDFRATAAVGGSLSLDQETIGAKEITGRANGSQKAVTTGAKKLGDPARGEVTVYNWTNSQKSFTQGTGIITKNAIKFTLENDIEVASRSATVPGQTNTKVVAVEVGPSGNLEAGQDFSFQEFDELSYSAINSAAFSGGAERQTTVVTQEDMDRLEKELTETIAQKAREDLKNQASGQNLLDSAIVIKILKRQFDKTVDEEAPLLNLDMEVEANAVVFLEEDLKKLLSEVFKGDAPQNREIRPENITLEDLSVSRNDDELAISGGAKIELIPKIDLDALRAQIAGKSVKEARAKVKEIPEVAQVEVNFKPNIPIISSIPRNKNKITFKIETI